MEEPLGKVLDVTEAVDGLGVPLGTETRMKHNQLVKCSQ